MAAMAKLNIKSALAVVSIGKTQNEEGTQEWITGKQ